MHEGDDEPFSLKARVFSRVRVRLCARAQIRATVSLLKCLSWERIVCRNWNSDIVAFL